MNKRKTIAKRSVGSLLLASLAFFYTSPCPPVPSNGRVEANKLKAIFLKSPHKFAWTVFAAINRPAPNATDNNVEWENWLEDSDIFTANSKATAWNSGPKTKRLHKLSFDHKVASGDAAGKCIESPAEMDKSLSEIHINGYGSNGSDQIFNINLQKQRASISGTIWFSAGVRAVKARWKIISNDAAEKAKYHWQQIIIEQQGQRREVTIGLIALSLSTNDTGSWVWATWEHLNNDCRCVQLPCVDPFGIRPAITHGNKEGQVTQELKDLLSINGTGAEWENYRLVGVQSDFLDQAKKPILLGNSILEGQNIPLNTSSCATCHARSAVGGDGFRPDPVDPGGNGYVGPALDEWYKIPGSDQLLMKLDSLWSARKVDNPGH